MSDPEQRQDEAQERVRRIWHGDWVLRVRERVHAVGFATLREFLAAHPGESYVRLTERLGDVAAIQLIWSQYREARDGGWFRESARDGLSRKLAENMRRGWDVGRHAEVRQVGAYVDWSIAVNTEQDAKLKGVMGAVWDELKALPPPRGWTPAGPDDPLISLAFDRGWPA